MKPIFAIPATLATILALAPAFSGCGGEAVAPPPDAGDIAALKEKQMEIMRKERDFQPSNKRPARN
ncbi:hypothetical protein [Paludisphaera sp.]|uniref:hypothetical protein n=1 Tax=Paludisphaera sp. TaxID=2017432 RepID=UPI00301C0DE6